MAVDLQATGSKIGASVLTPSSFDTGFARTARVRPASMGADSTPDGKATREALTGIVAQGAALEVAAAPVLEGIRSGTFLIPTGPRATKPNFETATRL
ncbi:MAG: hypothetical protein GY937_09915 [bacterium]|nr:hypothetical protein [bacterium]